MRHGRDWLQHGLASGADSPISIFVLSLKRGAFAGPGTKTQPAARHEDWLAGKTEPGRWDLDPADWPRCGAGRGGVHMAFCGVFVLFVLRGLAEVMLRRASNCGFGYPSVGFVGFGMPGHVVLLLLISISPEDASAGA